MTRKIFLAFLFIFSCAALALANENMQMQKLKSAEILGRIAILDEGRVKPLDTYSRNVLLQFSGKRTFEAKPAIEWLARLIFTPWQTANDKVFLINSPEIAAAIGIKPEAHRRYSFNDLKPGIEKLHKLAAAVDVIDTKERSLVEQEIVRVAHNLDLYIDLGASLSFTTPFPAFSIHDANVKMLLELPLNQSDFSFLDIALKADQLSEETKFLEGKRAASWNVTETEFMRLLKSLYQWSMSEGQMKYSSLTIIPPLGPGDEIWRSPGEMVEHLAHEDIRADMTFIQSMATAYRNGEQLEFDVSVKGFNSGVQKGLAKAQGKAYAKIPLELFYNQANLFRWAWVLYFLTFFAFLFSLIWPKLISRKIALSLLILGFAPHVLALALRIAIMARPPVTNLYETFIFVGAVTIVLSLVMEKFNKNWLGIVVGSISGLVFLAIADKFSAEGDTMRMLVAVLNSNFWLATHVLSITTGYAGCCVAGVIGHVYIIQALLKPKDKENLQNTHRYTLGALGFGLTMSFLGTMLGGIWADQSWGRFWGWDPKENGALLIVLWSAMLFHAKAGKMIGPLGMAVGAALGLIVVMWAWFGVNLLSIGLHSYGFTSGLATNLAIYVILEILFLSVTLILLGKRKVFI